jgi:hypothetical protein
MSDPLTSLQDQFRALAREVVAAADAEPKARGWTEVVLDARYSPHSSMQFRTLRARVAGQLVSVSGLFGNLAMLVREVRARNTGEPFYGFVLTATAKGAVDIRLNYNADCYSEPEVAAN